MEQEIIQRRPLTPRTGGIVQWSREQRVAAALKDPSLFSEYFLQSTLWDRQRDILHAVATKPRVAVKACHSSSKTYTAARATLWALAAHTDVIVVTTAPTWNQVEKLLWGEVHAALLKSRYPFPKALTTELRIGPKRYAYGLSTSVTKQDEGVKFQGVHAERVIVIMDEAPGVDPKIWEAVEGARAGGNVTVLAIGNPTIASGPFYDAFADERVGWTLFTIDAFDTPNIRPLIHRAYPGKKIESLTDEEIIQPILELSEEELDNNPCPYLTTRRWVKEKWFEWGPGHPSWESRVRGRFPKQSEDALLSLTWLELARLRELEATGKVKMGVDVAGPGEAETVCVARRGPKILEREVFPQSDPRGAVAAMCLKYRTDLEQVNVDSVGIGWNFYLHLLDLKLPAVPVNVAETSSDPEKYYNQRAEHFWGLRMRCQAGDLAGLTDDKMIGQLAGIRYKHNARGQIQIESKEDAAARGVKSPDRAEALMLAYAAKSPLVYGALDFFKQYEREMANMTVTAKMSKPAGADEALACPKCNATCVSRANGYLRCNQCGHQWTGVGDKPMTMPQFSRGAMLK